MGAEFGIDYAPGTDLKKVFYDLQDTARYEHGHGGYSGSIAEAAGVQLWQRTPLSLDAAQRLAEASWEDNRIQKWECAWAIPVVMPTREVDVTLASFTTTGDHEKDAAALNEACLAEARRKRLTRRGEAVRTVWKTSYRQPDHGLSRASYYNSLSPRTTVLTEVKCRVTLNKAKAALTPGRIAQSEPDGFVFMGWYSS